MEQVRGGVIATRGLSTVRVNSSDRRLAGDQFTHHRAPVYDEAPAHVLRVANFESTRLGHDRTNVADLAARFSVKGRRVQKYLARLLRPRQDGEHRGFDTVPVEGTANELGETVAFE